MTKPSSAKAGCLAAREALLGLLRDLRSGPLVLFEQRDAAVRRRRHAIQRRLLLGLELLWKIEGQVLLPALAESGPESKASIALTGQEIELLRDVSALTRRTLAANRDVALTVLSGLSTVHFERVDELLRQCDVAKLPWRELEREIRSLLERWQAEIASSGDIEDEERDPVGLPPR